MIPYRKKERGKCKHLDRYAHILIFYRVYSKDEYNTSPNPMRNTYIYPFVERDPYWKSKSKEVFINHFIDSIMKELLHR